VQNHISAALGAGDGFHLKLARAFTAPAHALVCGQTRAAAFHRHAVGNDVARIKTYAKLADEVGVFFLVAFQLGHELARAALGNGAQMGHGLVGTHAHAVVADGERFGRRIKPDSNF
jgi:hypothetical protein